MEEMVEMKETRVKNKRGKQEEYTRGSLQHTERIQERVRRTSETGEK